MNAQQRQQLAATMRANDEAKLEELLAAGNSNPAVRVWGMLPDHFYGATLKSARSMKVVGYEVGVDRRWMPVTVAKRLVKAGHCTWGLGGGTDHTAPGFWISLAAIVD